MLGLRLHSTTGTVCAMPQGQQKVPSTKHATAMKLNEAIEKVTELRSQGLTLQAIGNQLGLSRQRVHQIIHEGKEREQLANQWTNGLSTRNRHLLDRLNIKCREEAIVSIQTLEIRPYRWKNFGLRSYHDLCAWLGISPISSKYSRKLAHICPHCHKEINR
jgi:hypothetical protein